MEFRRIPICFCIVIFQWLLGGHLHAQNTPADSAQVKGRNSAVFSIDVLSSVIYSGRNYGVEQIGFNPSVVFYHKSGLALNMYSYGMEKTDGLITETDLGIAYKFQIHPKLTLTPGYAYLFNRVQDEKVLFNVINLGTGLNLKFFSVNNYLGFSFGGGRTSWYEEFSLARYINVLYREKGSIRAHGFNTDADAITRSLREDLGVEPRGARVLLLGAGGAGRTAALRLAAEGAAALHLVNRTLSKAAELATEIERRSPGVRVTVGYPTQPVDLVLNATSLGLKSADPLPLPPGAFDLRQTRAVYDMIYRPAETPLLQAARAAGCRTANGLGMLLYQGAEALEIWTGQPAPLAAMRTALERNIYG